MRLRVLHIEDSANDAELIRAKLESEGIPCDIDRVASQEGVLEHVSGAAYDIVLCDYSIPAYDGKSALLDVKASQPDVPFIFVSGTIGEVRAIEVLKLGATDYVLKDDLTRLAPSIRRAIRESDEHRMRKRAEGHLAQREAYLRSVIETEPECVKLIDLEGTLLEINRAGVEMIEAESAQELIGRPIDGIVHPDFREQFRRLRSAVTMGESQTLEFEIVGLKGTRRWMDMHAVPFRNEQGNVNAILAISRDITEQRAAQDHLRESEANYRSLFDSARDSIFSLSPTGIITSLNRAFEETTGFDRGEWVGKGFPELLHPEDRQLALETFQASLRGELENLREYRFRTKSGVFLIGELTTTPQRINGKLHGVVGIVRDVTRRKELERQLVQSQKLESLGTLAGGIAHDFNNVLSIIMAYLSLLTREAIPAEKRKQTLDTINTAVHRGAALVKQLLTFARKTEPLLEMLDVNTVVQEIGAMLRATFPKTIEFKIVLDESIPRVAADQAQLHQAVLNLCVNARDAMPQGGTLMVTTAVRERDQMPRKFSPVPQSRYLAIEVGDTGIGMSEEVQKRIFEPFFTTKEIGKGTGLGLAVLYGVVKTHAGFVDVESEPGLGSSFTLFLPVGDVDREPDAGTGEALEEIRGGSETILVVEDEQSLASIVCEHLREKGYRVLMASDGVEAVRVFGEHRAEVDLVLSDMGLPKMSGVDAAQRMRLINPELRVILASGFIDPEERHSIDALSVQAIIQKPYDIAEVLRQIQKAFERG